jgi:arylsulfatase A-like enzyme
VPFTAVHIPIKPTQQWLSEYYPERFDDDPLKDLSFKKYAAYTSHMDHGIGQLLESLERTSQRENTVVVFSSDNGAINDSPLHATDKYPGWQEAYPRLGSNAPYRGVKAQLYEGGIRTPTVVNWRGRLAPGVVDHPVQVVDWMPTLTRLTGAEPQEDPCYDGRDVWPLIAGGGESPPQRRLYWNFRGGRQTGLRHGDWKLISSEQEGRRRVQLFNIGEDPFEEHDVAADHPDRAGDLAGMIDEEGRQDGVSARTDVDSPMVG